jgi:uncharacterized protein GlcG (DUF336 family)
MLRRWFAAFVLAALPVSAALADDGNCQLTSTQVAKVQSTLLPVTQMADANGGIFHPNRMWSAVVDRAGNLCSIINTDATNGDAWPGSRAIAIAKAETANDFSNSGLALSTANLYAPTQPGGSLYGLNNSNPFNPAFGGPIAPTPTVHNAGVPGGIITFGGGVALYSGGQVIGGLGVSGDSSCADHAIAYRMRRLSGFDHIPGGVGPGGTDNIDYAPAGVAPTGFQQPHCNPAVDITP